MNHVGSDHASLRSQIAELRREVAELTQTRNDLRRRRDDGRAPGVDLSNDDSGRSSRTNIYVFDDDAEGAKAFDEFYRAYDEVHAKTRKFLLD